MNIARVGESIKVRELKNVAQKCGIIKSVECKIQSKFMFPFQMNHVYNELLMKQKQAEIMSTQGKHKYEYDSDEDTEVL